MGKEIERKFLVSNPDILEGLAGTFFHQGYLSTDKDRIVRVRIMGERGVLTIKGIDSGFTRLEYEFEVPVADAQEMLDRLCLPTVIQKHRYLIPYHGFTWEVDVFHGDNEGLIVAEIELSAEDEAFDLPDWIGKEVTEDQRYYNASLVKKPYNSW